MKFKSIFLFLCILSLIPLVVAQVGFPHAYYGSVTYNNAPGDGISIKAKIEGSTVATTTALNGYYILTVSNNNNDKEGKTLSFFVNDIDTGVSIIYNSEGIDATTELNLSASSPSTNGGDGNGGGNGGGGGGNPPLAQDDITSYGEIDLGVESEGDQEGDFLLDEEQTQEQTKPGITGAVIGFVKSGIGMGLVIAVIILILGIIVITITRKK